MRRLIPFISMLFSLSAHAQLTIASVFADNMVLQRDRPFVVSGRAIPGKNVLVSLSGKQRKTVAGSDSVWKVLFPPLHASRQPVTLQVESGAEKKIISNMLIGDRWLCLGQSNMEWPVQKEMHFDSLRMDDVKDLTRFYNPTYAGKNIFNSKYRDSVSALLFHGQFYRGNWEVPDPVNVRSMSAVAWYFGTRIIAETHVPVGLVNLSIGGAPLETFIDIDVLKKNKAFSAKADTGWLYNPALPVWIRERGMQNTEGVASVPKDQLGPEHAYKPGYAFKEGIKPLMALPCKGMIWYQGESNAQEPERVSEYAVLFKLLTEDYRQQWNDPLMPCYWVQLSSIDTVKYKGQLWGWFRDEQRKMLGMIQHSGMAVCSDIGSKNDVHPTDKRTVGERLARLALFNDYNRNILPSGPMPLEAVWIKGRVVVRFRYKGNGLGTNGNAPLQGFSTDGITPVPASIRGGQVEIPLAVKPAFIYYGWKSWSDGDLVNSEGLPASTFKIPVK